VAGVEGARVNAPPCSMRFRSGGRRSRSKRETAKHCAYRRSRRCVGRVNGRQIEVRNMRKKMESGLGRKKKLRAASKVRERNHEAHARKDDDADRRTFKVALQCASVGLPVAPLHGRMGGACTCGKGADCKAPGMHPRTGATKDLERIKDWKTKWANTKIGIATGGDAGIIAIGLEGDSGRASLKELQDRNTRLPKTVTIRSSNRRVYFFRIGTARVNRAVERLGNGIAVIGDGRFVVAPFDLHDPEQARRFVNGRGPDEVEIAAAPPWLINLISEPTSTASQPAPSVLLVRTSDIVPEKIEWLWPGFIATGRLTGLVGYPGVGKSQVAIDLAATVSTGRGFPGGGSNGKRGHVIILAAEDHPADTIVPRLLAAGADLNRVHIVKAVKDGEGERPFNLSLDLDRLEKECLLSEVKLVVIDPASAYLGKATGSRINRNSSGDVRTALARLAAFAEEHELAVVAVSHLNKSSGSTAITRIMGSTEWVAVPRAVFLVAEEPGTDRRLFLPLRNKLAPDRIGYAFHIEDRVVGANGISTSAVVWDRDPVTITADEALAATTKKATPSAAIDFLQQALSDGPMDQAEIVQLGKEAGFSEKSLRTAREKLGVKPRKEGFGASGKWVWVLPTGAAVPTLVVDKHQPPTAASKVDDGGTEPEIPEDRASDGGAA
jgi:putative DNA primase/helicase